MAVIKLHNRITLGLTILSFLVIMSLEDGYNINNLSIDSLNKIIIETVAKYNNSQVDKIKPKENAESLKKSEDVINSDYVDELNNLTKVISNLSNPSVQFNKSKSWLAEKVSIVLAERFKLNRQQINTLLPRISLKGTPLENCEEDEGYRLYLNMRDVEEYNYQINECAYSKYRDLDGHCNNFLNGNWGNAMKKYERFLYPSYADGVAKPRSNREGNLVSARNISAYLHINVNKPDHVLTHMFMQFGQFIAHDITSVLGTVGDDGTIPICCGKEGDVIHEECFPISVDENDPFYKQFGLKCMEFLRSAPSPRPSCKLGPREQVNSITSFLDGSSIYGDSLQKGAELRTFTGGKLRSVPIKNTSLKPLLLNKAEDYDKCSVPSITGQCDFRAGDARLNLHVALIVMHTIWLREHNRIADNLHKINPQWDSESLYQEAKRIVTAEFQHVTLKEYLPLLLGDELEGFDLAERTSGYYNGYNVFVNPTVRIEFASAAFRFGHTLIQSSFDLRDHNYKKVNEKPNNLSDLFLNPKDIYTPGNVDNYVRGMLLENSQEYDEFITDQVSNFLFKRPNGKFGIDLVATNIQRGRDHGIAPYMIWRKWCGLKTAENFEELEDIIPSDKVQKLKRLYRSVEEIDLYSAGLSETPVHFGVVGPTFACIIGKQFELIRQGDRYWYENPSANLTKGLLHGFTKEQLSEIKSTSFAKILCDNGDNIKSIQKHAFIFPMGYRNPMVNCADLPSIDFRHWKNEDASTFSKSAENLTLKEAVDFLIFRPRTNRKIIFPNKN